MTTYDEGMTRLHAMEFLTVEDDGTLMVADVLLIDPADRYKFPPCPHDKDQRVLLQLYEAEGLTNMVVLVCWRCLSDAVTVALARGAKE